MTLRERVAHIFDPAAFSDEAAVIERTNPETFWPMRRHFAFEKADAIIQLILEEAAKVADEVVLDIEYEATDCDRSLHPQEEAERRIALGIATAIRKLGSDARG